MATRHNQKLTVAVLAAYAVSAALFREDPPANPAPGGQNPGQDPNPTPPPATDPNANPNPDPNADPDKDKPKDAAYWEAKAKDNAREAQALRKERAEQAAKLKEFEDKDKSELQKATERAEAAEKAAKDATERALSSRIMAEAARKGFADPEDAARFVDLSKVSEDFGNIGELLDGVLTAKPYLKGNQNGVPATPGGNPAGGGSGTAQSAREAAITNELPWLQRRIAERNAVSGKK